MALNSKGNVAVDGLLFLVVAFGFALAVIAGYSLFGELNTDIQNEASFTNVTKTTSSTWYARYPDLFDSGFLLIIILLWVMVIVASFMVDSHPVFFGISLILFIFVMIVAWQLSNVWVEVNTDATFSVMESDFPVTYWIFDHLLQLTIAVGCSIAIALYSKSRLL